jgi:hypothetical protein
MTEEFSQAHRRLDRILRFFLVVCVAGLLVGIVNNDWSFAAVWLVAGFLNGVIGFAVRERGRIEPLRDCRRPQLLRRWGRYEQDNEQIFN